MLLNVGCDLKRFGLEARKIAEMYPAGLFWYQGVMTTYRKVVSVVRR